jgi:hypothetical protein
MTASVFRIDRSWRSQRWHGHQSCWSFESFIETAKSALTYSFIREYFSLGNPVISPTAHNLIKSKQNANRMTTIVTVFPIFRRSLPSLTLMPGSTGCYSDWHSAGRSGKWVKIWVWCRCRWSPTKGKVIDLKRTANRGNPRESIEERSRKPKKVESENSEDFADCAGLIRQSMQPAKDDHQIFYYFYLSVFRSSIGILLPSVQFLSMWSSVLHR